MHLPSADQMDAFQALALSPFVLKVSCGKSDDEVAKMVDGKHAFICDRCVQEAGKLLVKGTQPCGYARYWKPGGEP
jgi:hypothetical protein